MSFAQVLAVQWSHTITTSAKLMDCLKTLDTAYFCLTMLIFTWSNKYWNGSWTCLRDKISRKNVWPSNVKQCQARISTTQAVSNALQVASSQLQAASRTISDVFIQAIPSMLDSAWKISQAPLSSIKHHQAIYGFCCCIPYLYICFYYSEVLTWPWA